MHELKFEYNEIEPQIFLGTTMCCQKHFEEELIAKGISAEEAMKKIKEKRPIIHPNEAQFSALQEFEKRMKEK